MSVYRQISAETISRIDDNGATRFVPVDAKNADYQQYLDWVAEGNTPTPADPPPVIYDGETRISSKIVPLMLRRPSCTA